MNTVISAEHVYASYGKISSLDDVALKVDTGTIYALLGPSGCGMTTLLSCILLSRKEAFRFWCYFSK